MILTYGYLVSGEWSFVHSWNVNCKIVIQGKACELTILQF